MANHPDSLERPSPEPFPRRLIRAALSLQCKATVLVVVLTLSVAAVVSGYLLRFSEKFAHEQQGIQMVQAASMLAKAAAPHFAIGDLAALADLADDSADGMPLLYVVISDAGGRQIAAAQDDKTRLLAVLEGPVAGRAPAPGQPVRRTGSLSAPAFLDVTYPVTIRESTNVAYTSSDRPSGTKLVGYVRTGMIEDRWQRTMASRLDLLIGVGILAAVAAIPLGFLLVRRIVSPLDGLAGAMSRFSRGELDVRSPVTQSDEIGRLAIAFNRMADEHQRTHEGIVRLNADLERRVAERTEQLRELASREPLTGLYNRRSFNEMLEHRFSEAKRYGGEISCIMLDLDDFKNVNDRFGHQVGDKLLILTAETITQQLRTSDVAARFGGDEFIVLLPQTDAPSAQVLGERIAEQLLARVGVDLPEVYVTVSMGVASLSSAAITSAEALIRAADNALYAAKAAGKDRIVVTSAPVPSAVA